MCKEILRHVYLKSFEPLLENLSLKFQKVSIRPKNISLAKFKYKYLNVAEYYADFYTVEKNEKKVANKKVTDKKFL